MCNSRATLSIIIILYLCVCVYLLVTMQKV